MGSWPRAAWSEEEKEVNPDLSLPLKKGPNSPPLALSLLCGVSFAGLWLKGTEERFRKDPELDGERQEEEESRGERRGRVGAGAQKGLQRVSSWKERGGASSGGWRRRGRSWGGGVVPVLGGFCSVVSEGISDSKVNCGVLSLPSSNKQCSECLMFPSHRIS